MSSASNDTSNRFAVRDPSVRGVGIWLAVAACAIFVGLVVYEILRMRPSWRRFYYPRYMHFRQFTPTLPHGIFKWISAATSIDEEFLVQNVGLDAVMFLRFLHMSFVLFLILTVVMVPCLVMNFLGGHFQTTTELESSSQAALITDLGLVVFSMGNIPERSHILWLHVVSLYLVSGLTMLCFYSSFLKYTELTRVYLNSVHQETNTVVQLHSDSNTKYLFCQMANFTYEKLLDFFKVPRRRENTHLTDTVPPWRESELYQLKTIFMQNIPSNLSNELNLKAWIEHCFGAGVIECIYANKVDEDLALLYAKRERTLMKLELAYHKWEKRINGAIKNAHKRQYMNSENHGNLFARAARWFKYVFFTPQPFRVNRHLSFSENYEISAKSPTTPGCDLHFCKMSESYSNETNIVDAGEAASLRPKKRRSQTGVKMQDLGFDAITHYSRKLEVLSQCVLDRRNLCNNLHSQAKSTKSTSYAFVTFKSQKIAQIASQILLVAPLSTLSVRPAPVPNDILWNSALSSPARHTLLNVVNKIVALVICLFWTIPTSIIASAASSSTLTEIGHLDPIFTDPTFSFILENVIPPLITNFFNAFVPTIFEWLAFRSSLECHTWIEMRIMHQYLLFLWLNTFFVFSSTSTIFLIFDNFFDSPKFILQTIAETMAKGSTFFIYYIILNILLFLIEILRPIPLMYLMTIKHIKAQTPRTQHNNDIYTSSLNYGILYPSVVIIFVISLFYSIISPLILIPAVLYFGIAWVVYRNQLLFVYIKLYESYGRHWIPSFTHCIIGLFLSQLVIIGYLFAKTAPYEALACCPLLLGTHYYYRHTINTFRPHTQYVPQDQLSLEEIIEQISGSIRDTDRVVDTLENHYQTVYSNPAHSKKLESPWISSFLAPYIPDITQNPSVILEES